MENLQKATESILQQRMTALMLLRRAFADEPDDAFMELLGSKLAIEAIDTFAVEGQNELSRLAETMRTFSENGVPASLLEDVRSEYTKLFVGPEKILAPFWESVYLDPRELLFLESTTDVRKRYEAEGLRLDSETREAEDSVFLELDFVAHLAERTLEAFRNGDRTEFDRLVKSQRTFEHDHLLNWLPLFAERAKGARTDYLYPTLCAAVAAFVAIDAAILEELAEEA